jgi:hypothetical protein
VTTHRRYTFLDSSPRDPGKVLGILQHACETSWWFNEPQVLGEDTLTFSFTVSGRDQWWAHKRAMDLAERVYRGLKLGPAAIPVPLWQPLAPHTNRGRFRVPTT